MAELPRPIAEYLFTSVGLERSPAYLAVSADGLLVDWGGHLDTYGIGGLVRGRSAQDQVVVLQGLLPTAGHEMCLPCVRVGGGAPADVYLFRHEHTDWVLLLDASAFDLRMRCVQQVSHEHSLSREPRPVASSVLRALDMVVLERTPDDRLVPVTDAPAWLTAALPGASRFLENFMIDAAAQWRLDCEGASVRSGPWHEDGLMSAGQWWDATALSLHGRSLMVITRSSSAAAERQRLLQTGRERGLELAARTTELAAASGRIVAEHAERQRTAVKNRLLAHAVESTNEMISVTGLDDHFTFVNRSFLEQYGYSESDVLGRHVSLIVSPSNPADVMALVLRATRSGGWTGELINRRKDGTEFPISLSTKPIRDETGDVIGLVGVARDITAQKQAEEALRDVEERLRQALKMEAIGRLAGGVAHDFNNLLTVMMGYAEMAMANTDPSGPVYQDIERVRQASERAAALTRQLLAFSRRQVLTPGQLDVNDLVRHVGSMLHRLIGEDVRLVITCAPSPARVMADAGQLEQVIMNLAVNARDAMPTGGFLRFEVSITDLHGELASRFEVPDGRYVILVASDTGLGMNAATLSRVFEPFFTTKPSGKGTGLGLATTYGIVRQSGGGIAVESEPGRGSRFTICLPSVEGGTAIAAPDTPTARSASGSEVVLLVEDDEVVRVLVTTELTNRGFEVICADSGEEAIRISNDRAAPIHLMLSDTVMPGLGGRELAERMAAIRPDMKVLLMSGYTSDLELQFQIRNRDVAFLQKPFTSEVLARKVFEVLESD